MIQEKSAGREKLGEVGKSQSFLAMPRSLIKQYDSGNALKLRYLLKPGIVF